MVILPERKTDARSLMPALSLNDATYRKFTKFKDEVVSMDVFACKDTDNLNEVNFFWNDDMIINFILDVMSERLLDEKVRYRNVKNKLFDKDLLESLR